MLLQGEITQLFYMTLHENSNAIFSGLLVNTFMLLYAFFEFENIQVHSQVTQRHRNSEIPLNIVVKECNCFVHAHLSLH